MSAHILALVDRALGVFGLKTTTVSATAQFGPPPGSIYCYELARYTDEYLSLAERDEIIARAQADAAARNRRKVSAR